MNLLEIVRQCHNHNPWRDSRLTPFHLSPPPLGVQIGFLQDSVVEAIEDEVKRGSNTFTLGHTGKDSRRRTFVAISEELRTYEERSDAMRTVVESWRDRGLFPDPLNGAWKSAFHLRSYYCD